MSFSIPTIVAERLKKLGTGNEELLDGSLEFYSGEQVATVLLCANNNSCGKEETKSCKNAGLMACSNVSVPEISL
jgi:hypothetical protein